MGEQARELFGQAVADSIQSILEGGDGQSIVPVMLLTYSDEHETKHHILSEEEVDDMMGAGMQAMQARVWRDQAYLAAIVGQVTRAEFEADTEEAMNDLVQQINAGLVNVESFGVPVISILVQDAEGVTELVQPSGKPLDSWELTHFDGERIPQFAGTALRLELPPIPEGARILQD